MRADFAAQSANLKLHYFEVFQEIAMDGAVDWQAFTIDNEMHMAVATCYNGSTYTIDSKIYCWNGTSFVEAQSIASSRASDLEAFANNIFI